MVGHVAGVHDLEAATVELERGVLLVGAHEVAGEVGQLVEAVEEPAVPVPAVHRSEDEVVIQRVEILYGLLFSNYPNVIASANKKSIALDQIGLAVSDSA